MSLVETLKIIVLGIVEGFTEWLPISSTGHMILVDEIIRLNQPEAFKEVFRVVIQLGAENVPAAGRHLGAVDQDRGSLRAGGGAGAASGRLDGGPPV